MKKNKRQKKTGQSFARQTRC